MAFASSDSAFLQQSILINGAAILQAAQPLVVRIVGVDGHGAKCCYGSGYVHLCPSRPQDVLILTSADLQHLNGAITYLAEFLPFTQLACTVDVVLIKSGTEQPQPPALPPQARRIVPGVSIFHYPHPYPCNVPLPQPPRGAGARVGDVVFILGIADGRLNLATGTVSDLKPSFGSILAALDRGYMGAPVFTLHGGFVGILQHEQYLGLHARYVPMQMIEVLLVYGPPTLPRLH